MFEFMTRLKRIRLIIGLAILISALFLAVGAGAAWLVRGVSYPAGPLPPELKKLVADLEGGKRFSKLEEISPVPDAIYGPKDSPWNHPRGHHFLKYRLPDGRNLVIILDENLDLVDDNID
jgi:hypothetical protein